MLLRRHTARIVFGRIGRAGVVAAVLIFGTYAAYGQELYTGTLGAKDATLSSGEYADSYPVFASIGDWIHVAMTSPEFDPYVILKPPSCPVVGTCELQRDNDDVQSGDETAGCSFGPMKPVRGGCSPRRRRPANAGRTR